MADCKICVKFDDCPWRSDPDAMCSGFRQRPMTNADRIRSMTDEELVEELLEWYAAFSAVEWSKDMILDWLKEEVSDGIS